MAAITHIMRYGDQLGVHFDNGVVVMAFPTDIRSMWIAGANGNVGPGSGEFIWPFSLDTVSSEYGPRDVTKFHEGIDLAPGAGQQIHVAGDGQVSVRQYHNNFGNMIIVDHGIMTTGTHAGKRVRTLYAHMENTSPLAPGVPTTAGVSVAGTVGDTGASFGAHLHFEIHVTDDGAGIVWNTNNDGGFRTAVDPRDFMTEYGNE